jgi:hypothetical protein
MKKILLLVLAVLCLSLVSCSDDKYEPVESTKEEARVVYTMFLDGEKYEVKYELYRMLFLNSKSIVDGGNPSVWDSAEAGEYIERINGIIYERAAEIFSVFHFARELGINPYSAAVNDKIYEYIVLSVEGNGGGVKGHGSYESFLLSLKDRNMNYSVMELLLRYSIVYSYIAEEYEGVEDEVLGRLPGNIEINRDEVFSYYMSDECARILQMVCADESKMAEHRSRLSAKKTDKERALYIIRQSTALHTDCIVDKEVSGVIVGKYAQDAMRFGEYTEAALSLSGGQIGEVFEISGEFYLAIGLEKSEEHFDRCYDAVRQSYIDNEVGKRLENTKLALIDTLEATGEYSQIQHALISMK